MQGTDHMEPVPETPGAIAYANDHLVEAKICHSTIPAYIQAVQSELNDRPLQTISGDFRSPKRFHLLPAVLSARAWIKQRNHACETLLEKWVEPFTTFARLVRADSLAAAAGLPAAASSGTPHPIEETDPLVRQAWRLLMECHPHDSICGCSIDQVHEEMRPRFDQVEQIGEALVQQSLEGLSESINTALGEDFTDAEGKSLAQSQLSSLQPLVIFNPLAFRRSELVQISLPVQPGQYGFEVFDRDGRIIPNRLIGTTVREVANLSLDKDQLQTILGGAQAGSVAGLAIQGVSFRRDGNALYIDVELAESGETRPKVVAEALPVILDALADPAQTRFLVTARTTTARIELWAEDLPACGYRTFWARPLSGPGVAAGLQESNTKNSGKGGTLENEFFLLRVSPQDGTLTLTDKRSRAIFTGLNRFMDGGDIGDEYNYCPPERDKLLAPQEIEQVNLHRDGVHQSIEVRMNLYVPAKLEEDRQARQKQTVALPIVTRYRLLPGSPRVEIHTQINNTAQDHRLRAHFPAPFKVEAADYEGHFEVVRRPTALPPHDPTWAEQPRPEQPQRAFTSIQGRQAGLVVANRGLPEVEVLYAPDGNTEVALTLLRCTGWLSRDDLTNRKGHAGPGLPTPGAQMPGVWEFDYAIIPTLGTPDAGSPLETLAAYEEAWSFNVPLRGIAVQAHGGALPGSDNLLNIQPRSFILSTVKAAEDGRGWIVRGYHLGSSPILVRVKPWRRFRQAARTNLAEVDQVEIAVGPDGAVENEVRGHEIATFRFLD